MSIIQGSANRASVRGFYPKTINGSLRFNDDDSAYLSWTPAFAGNRKTWTFSCWFKPTSTFTTSRALFSAGTGTTDATFGQILLANDSTIRVNGYSTTWRGTSRLFRDPSAWYHLVVLFDTTQATAADRVKVYINGTQETAFNYNNNPTQNADYAFNQSAVHYIGRIDSAIGTNYLNEYLAEVFFIDGTAHTASDFGETKAGNIWVPKNVTASNFTMGTNGFHLTFEDDTAVEAFNTNIYRGNGGTVTQEFGFDPDLVWYKNRSRANTYHYLFDTVRGADRALYSNLTSSEDSQFPTYNQQLFVPNGSQIVRTIGDHLNYDGDTYVAWAWDAGANNAVTGHSSVTYTGNSGTQRISGFPFRPDLIWIKARNTASFYHHISDSVRGFDKYLFPNVTLAEETNTSRVTSTTNDGMILGNKNDTNTAYNYVAWAWDAGDSDPVSNTTGDTAATVKTNGDFSIMAYSGTGAATSIGHGLSSAPNFVIVKDRSAAQNWVVWTDDINTNGNQYLELNQTSAIQSSSVFWNSTAPDASKIYLGTSNSVSGRNFICYAWRNVTNRQKFGTYEGNNTATGPTVNVGFRPGFVMIKNADGTGNWNIFDGSRFPFANNDLFLRANLAAAEVDGSGEGADAYEVEFTSTGFIPKASGASSRSQVNGTGTYIYAAFAGSYSDYITDYNTDGSIDSRVKANDTTGFSIVSYQGTLADANIGHGLSSAPDMIIIKNRNRTLGTNWVVYHSALGASQRVLLNDTASASSSGNIFGSTPTAPDATKFYVGNVNWVNNNVSGENDHIAYCWTATTGVSAFGSYTGTGSAGLTVTTGFRPSFVIVKRDGFSHWEIHDSTRDVTTTKTKILNANQSNAEDDNANSSMEFTDTGFIVQTSHEERNFSGDTYIYAAFADTREAAFWLDQSSNDNDWQPVNLDHNDTVADSPTNNFATLNPLNKYSGTTLSDGNLTVSHGSSGNGWCTTGVTHGLPRSGKFYVEFTIGAITGSDYIGIGISEQGRDFVTQSGDTARFDWGRVYFGHQGIVGPNNTSVQGTSVAPTYTTGDVISVAWDGDTGKVWWAKNGTWTNSGNPSTGTNPAYSGLTTKDYVLTCEGYNGAKATFNAGQQPFKYDPPA